MTDVNGTGIRYEVTGEGDPLILIHAGIANGRMWEPQIEAFSRRFRVVRYDVRGFGGTPPVAGPYAHHADLRGLLGHLGIERASLVGCSRGGAVALDFALSYPEATAALVLACSAVGGFDTDLEPPVEWEELVAAEEAADLERVSELEVRIWVDGPGHNPGRADPEIRDLLAREMNLIALRNEATGLGEALELDPPAAARLHEVRAPALVVAAELDPPVTIQRADVLARDIRGARRVATTGVAHFPTRRAPRSSTPSC